MEAALFIGGLMILATAIMFAPKYFHNRDDQMSQSLVESVRTDDLLNDAIKRYPSCSNLKAMQHYLWDMEERIEALRTGAANTDVVYAIESDMKDCDLMRKEISRLIKMEIDFNSHFSITTSAQA